MSKKRYSRYKKGPKEPKVQLNTPYVQSEIAPEGYYPTVENEEGVLNPLVELPTVHPESASPTPYSRGWYTQRPNQYNPYVPLDEQNEQARADYMANSVRSATGKAAPWVGGTLLAAGALPYMIGAGLGAGRAVGEVGKWMATQAGKKAAKETGKRLLFDTVAGTGAWYGSNAVTKEVTDDKTLDEYLSSGLQQTGMSSGTADVVAPFLNPFGYVGVGTMEGAAKSLPYMVDKTKDFLSKTWNNYDSKFLRYVYPSRAIKLLDNEFDKTLKLYNSTDEAIGDIRKRENNLAASIDEKIKELRNDTTEGGKTWVENQLQSTILDNQKSIASYKKNVKFNNNVILQRTGKGTKQEPLSYIDLNGNEVKANAVMHNGDKELKTSAGELFVKDGKIQDENIGTVTTVDNSMNYFEPSSNDVQKAIYNDYQKISSDIGESGVVGGSYALYSHGITGSPHDLEVYTTPRKLKDLERSMGLKHTTTGSMVENYTSKYAENNPAHNVQVCLIEGNGTKSWGHNAESIYASLHPEEYFKLRESYSFNNSGKRKTGDLKIEIPMSPEQLLQEMKNNPDVLVKKVFIDNMVSGKGKHAQRIYEAALSQPKLMNACISTLNKSMFGRDFLTRELYPSIDFSNIEANKELLNLIGYDEKYATNPEVMESIFRLFDSEATWGTAGSHSIPDKKWSDQIINSTTSKNNGASAGANMARSPVGGGEEYAENGLMTIRRFLLTYENNKINNVADYIKQLKRLNATSQEPVSNVLTTKQIETFNNFIKKHDISNHVNMLSKDDTAEQMFVKINTIQSELNDKLGNLNAASDELLNLYRELDLPFLYNANKYRDTKTIGLNRDILSGGYMGGLSRPIAYGTKNSALYKRSERLEGSQLRMENAHVYDVMDIFNPKSGKTQSYGKTKLDDQLKSIIEKRIKDAEDAIRKDYSKLLQNDFHAYPYYMTKDVLPSQKAREIGRQIENEYIPLSKAEEKMYDKFVAISNERQALYNKRFDLTNQSQLNHLAFNISSGVAAFVGGIYSLYKLLGNVHDRMDNNRKKIQNENNRLLRNYMDYFNVPENAREQVNKDIEDTWLNYYHQAEQEIRSNNGQDAKMRNEWMEENPDAVYDIIKKYQKNKPYAYGGPIKPYVGVPQQMGVGPITNKGATIYPEYRSMDMGANLNIGNLSIGAGLSRGISGGMTSFDKWRIKRDFRRDYERFLNEGMTPELYNKWGIDFNNIEGDPRDYINGYLGKGR